MMTERKGYTLKIDGGFASKTFPGGELQLVLSEIMNPLTDEELDKGFSAEVYDLDGGLLY